MASPLPVLCFGEMLLRLSSPVGELLLQSPRLDTCWGGAEINVAVSLARLGQPAAVLTVLPDNAIGHAARAGLQAHGVDVSRVRFAPGRMGCYFLTPGAVSRPSEVIYDRAASAFARADLARLDWLELIEETGWLHVSGVTAAIGRGGADGALAAMRAASASRRTVSFDGNFRGKLWETWDGDAPAILAKLFDQADLVFADDRDMALILGRRFDGADPLERTCLAAQAAFRAFPKLSTLACTIRSASSADRQTLSAAMIRRAQPPVTSSPRQLEGVVERIGSGDAFAAGLLFAMLRGRDDQTALDFALAAASLKHSIVGDFNPVTESHVLRAMAGGLEVQR